MARRDDLEHFVREHDLKIGSIEDLIRYRIENEHTVERVAACPYPTQYGEFTLMAYQDRIDNLVHLALVMGDIQAEQPTLVRVHLENALCDLLPSSSADCGWPLRDALRRIAEQGCGVAVVLRKCESPADLVKRIRRMSLTLERESTGTSPAELRTHGIGAQILADLGVRKMRLMSAPKRFHGLGGFGLEVTEYVRD